MYVFTYTCSNEAVHANPPPPQISSLTFNNANSFDVICLRVYVVREEFCS